MTYVGLPVSHFRKKYINTVCPNYEQQLQNIYKTLKEKYNYRHSDARPYWNRCIDASGVVRIIDVRI